jgi:uncharacterized protein with ParB-like and HNH nuclease domain
LEAKEKKVIEILTENKCYEIPRYQRPYSWTDEQTKELLQDINDVYDGKQREYFIGSIITIEKEKDVLYEVVDGQQRLITLNLIFAKLRDLIQDDAIKADLQKRIMPFNVYTKTPETPRLIVRKEDQGFFRDHILLSKPIKYPNDLLKTQKLMNDNSKAIEDFLNTIEKDHLPLFANYILNNVYLVFVKTNDFPSAYRLFNVLNNRGLSLSNSDLLKTRLFELSDDSEINKNEIERRWSELEDLIGLEDLDIFLSHYRTSIMANKQEELLFKEYERILKKEESPVKFCEKLASSAKNYAKIKDSEFVGQKEKRLIKSLNRVSHDEWYPPLLAFMNNPIKDLSFLDYLSYIEKITMQNWVRRRGKTQRNTVYYNLIQLINNAAKKDDIVTKIKEHANNNEFISFMNGDVYDTQYAKAILLRVEEEFQDESVTKDFSGLISIEHILPQKLTDAYWKERFNEESHQKYLHKLGNLTLLSGRKNSSAQYYSFPKKKEVYLKASAKVSFDITKEVCYEDDWNIQAIEKRQDKFIKKAKELWGL